MAYHKEVEPHRTRANAVLRSLVDYAPAWQAFLEFVLTQDVDNGRPELDNQRLARLLELKFWNVRNAKKAWEPLAGIWESFLGIAGRD